MINFNTITSQITVGTCPSGPDDVKALAETGVSDVVCLQSDHDLVVNGINLSELQSAYRDSDILLHRVAMTDFDETNISGLLDIAVETVEAATTDSRHVYLHCTAGRERSPTVAVAWLMRNRELSLKEAVELVVTRRPIANPYIEMLAKWVSQKS